MRKILLTIVLLSSIFSKEVSGPFIGVGGGYSFNSKANVIAKLNGGTLSGEIKMLGDGFNLDFMSGYKFMFGDNFGLRVYAGVDYTPYLEYKDKNGKFKLANKENGLSIGANVDLLVNVVSTSGFDFGLYAGMQGGFNTWGGDLIKEAKEAFDKIDSTLGNYEVQHSNIFWDATLNAGLRFVIFGKSAIEAFIKYPILENVIYKNKQLSAGEKIILQQPLKVGLRYVYTF